MEKVYDVIIIGAGCTGYAAGMYCGRFGIKTLLIGEDHGGLITWTDTVENYPGFIKLTGMELADKLRDHAKDYPIEMISERVIKIEKKSPGFIVSTKKNSYKTKTIIYATGTKVKELEVPGAQELKGRGLHFCALCDSYAYKNKTVG